MFETWQRFQGTSGEAFTSLFTSLPGSELLKLFVISAVLGIVLIWVYRFISFQTALANLKKRIATVALEPFLFSDSARISIYTPIKLLGLALKYMGLSIPPLLLLACPVIWVLGLLNQVIGYEATKVGEPLVVSIQADGTRVIRQLEAKVQGSDFKATSLVRSYHQAQAWLGLEFKSLGPNSPTLDNQLMVKVGNAEVLVPLAGKPTLAVISSSSWMRLLFPGSRATLPTGIKEISINYPAKYFDILGTAIPWAVLFLIVSMISGLIFAKLFKIQI